MTLETTDWWGKKRNSRPMGVLATRIPRTVVDAYQARAKKRGLTMSDTLAEALYRADPDLPWLNKPEEEGRTDEPTGQPGAPG